MALRKSGTPKAEQPIEEKVEEVIDVKEEKKGEVISFGDKEKELAFRINEKRGVYSAYADKQRKINTLVTAILVVVLIASFVVMMIFSQTKGILIGCVSLMALMLILSYVYTKLTKNKLQAEAKTYVDFLFTEKSKYVYDNKRVEGLLTTPQAQLELQYFQEAHFYTEIKGVKGRNFSHMKVGKFDIDVCELAGFHLVKGKTAPKFLGTFYSVKAPTKTNGKVTIFQLKGGKFSVPIDDVADLELIEGNDTYCIYSNDENVSKIMNKKLIHELSRIKVEDPVIDVLFSIKDNLVSIGIDYTDEFVNVPVEKEFGVQNAIKSKKDFEQVLNILDALSENFKNVESKE